MLQSRPQLDHLLKTCRVCADLLKIHYRHIAYFHRSIVQLGDHELKSPVHELRGLVEESAEVVRREQAGFLRKVSSIR